MTPLAELAQLHGLELQTSPDGRGAAMLSADGTRRYLLTRRWAGGPLMAWLMLNPSTADAVTDDATITRCTKRATQLQAGGIAVVNLFSLRATDPRELAAHPDPVGPVNDLFIATTCRRADLARPDPEPSRPIEQKWPQPVEHITAEQEALVDGLIAAWRAELNMPPMSEPARERDYELGA